MTKDEKDDYIMAKQKALELLFYLCPNCTAEETLVGIVSQIDKWCATQVKKNEDDLEFRIALAEKLGYTVKR